MDSILEIIDHSTWPDLVNDLRKNADESKIYRGHSNNYSIIKGKRDINGKIVIDTWKLISAFNRYYLSHLYLFRTFLKQQFADEFFKSQYGKYDFVEIFYLKDCSLLERLYYLQHYGVPTCFIDFTKNPLVALYFAISSVKGGNTSSLDSEGNPYYHPQEPFISVFEINHTRISELLDVKYIENDFFKKIYDSYDMYSCHIGFDINPLNNCQPNTLNVNLKKQDGCFVLYDNNNTTFSFVDYINCSFSKRGIKKETLIREYRLPYNTVFHNGIIDGKTNAKLFSYLDKNNVSGRTLFNDIQGLKYDLIFFHNS